MLTNLGKTLAVLIAVISCLVMGTAIALSFTSPPFVQQVAELPDYAITINPQTETSPRSYTGTRVLDEAVITTSEKLPDVVGAIYEDKVKLAKERLAELTQQKQFYDNNLVVLENTVAPDKAAMDRKVEELRAQVEAVRNQKAMVAGEVGNRQEEVALLLREAEARRADVFRVRSTLLQAKADAARNEQLTRQLEDLIAQIDGDLVKARNRTDQLQAQLGGNKLPEPSLNTDDELPPPPPAP